MAGNGHHNAMRPIAMQSVLWRVVASTTTRSEPVTQWLLQVVPPEAHWALPGRGVDTALAALEDEFHRKTGILITLDCTKAFDMVSPKFAIECLVAAGLPPVWAEMLGHVWLSQQRWLQWGSDNLPACGNVSQSMSQGDSFSPLTLNVLLSALACMSRPHHGHGQARGTASCIKSNTLHARWVVHTSNTTFMRTRTSYLHFS